MRGRKPNTTAVVELKGDRGRRGSADQKVAGLAGVPARPAWLDDRATELWDSAITWLGVDLGVLTRGDQQVLALFCQACSDFERITYQLREHGRFYVSQEVEEVRFKNGKVTRREGAMQVKPHPLCAQENELRRRIQSLGAELGLSPVARVRAAQAAGGNADRPGIGGFLGRK